MAENITDALDQELVFKNVVPPTTYWQRLRKTSGVEIRRTLAKILGGVPGFRSLRRNFDEPRLQHFTSSSGFMADWYAKDYGTPDKPDSIKRIPWDYVEKHQEEIPFYGLREYWYPALFSRELKANEHKAVEMLGDNIILFRGKDGAPAALENRCPHRGPLLSLGQVNVVEVGTITCRYHGMTFDGKGECVAFLADGPNSPACGRAKAKAYPVEEVNGVIFVYMGEKQPKSILDQMPHAREVLHDGVLIRSRMEVPYNYLNMLDNAVDMTHVGCLHRTCYLFGDQKVGGGVAYEELEGGGIYAHLRETGGHGGDKAIDDIRWFMPNLAHHGEEFMDGGVHGLWFWWVPKDVGSFTAWLIGAIKVEKVGRIRGRIMANTLRRALQSDSLPGMACFVGGDAPMQMSQGRIARWDREYLARTDRIIHVTRNMMKDAHKAEQEYRASLGLDPLPHRVRNQASFA